MAAGAAGAALSRRILKVCDVWGGRRDGGAAARRSLQLLRRCCCTDAGAGAARRGAPAQETERLQTEPGGPRVLRTAQMYQ
jgi:hypothetical protein